MAVVFTANWISLRLELFYKYGFRCNYNILWVPNHWARIWNMEWKDVTVQTGVIEQMYLTHNLYIAFHLQCKTFAISHLP